MNLLITGSSGFIGRNFINKNKEYKIVSVSLKNVLVENIDFTGIDTILHLAGLAHQMNGAPEEDYFNINTTLTYNFATKAKENGISHFIFISSAKVYGEASTIGKPFNEISYCFPIDAYSKSKLQAEEKLKSLEDSNFKVAILRIPLVYGAGVKGNLKVLMNLVHKISFIPLGNINNKRSMLYVGNLIDVLKLIVDQKQSGIFIACDNKSLSTSELIKIIAKSFDKKIILFKMPAFIIKIMQYVKPQTMDRLYSSFELDNTVTNQILGFAQNYSVEQGIKEMVNSYNIEYP
jgi:UDP-glucose 4-epimerase